MAPTVFRTSTNLHSLNQGPLWRSGRSAETKLKAIFDCWLSSSSTGKLEHTELSRNMERTRNRCGRCNGLRTWTTAQEEPWLFPHVMLLWATSVIKEINLSSLEPFLKLYLQRVCAQLWHFQQLISIIINSAANHVTSPDVTLMLPHVP